MLRGGTVLDRGRPKSCHVGAMLALFSLLGASWAHFSRLTARVGVFGRFFGVLKCFGHDFGASWAPFSWLLGRPRPHFSRLFCRNRALAQVR